MCSVACVPAPTQREVDECGCGGHLSRFLEPRLLLSLSQKESYGYELIDDINDLLFAGPPVDAGAIYRTLRRMERERLVRSRWDMEKSGPAKRVYRITKEGEERLHGWVVNLKRRKQALERFLKLYEGR